MEIVLKRIAKKASYTIGRLYLLKDGDMDTSLDRMERSVRTPKDESLLGSTTYFCDTLEPQWRNLKGGPVPPELVSEELGRVPHKKARKVEGLTAIPEGSYPVVITRSPRFDDWLPLLVGVPGFAGVRIHAGNKPRDTQGCILVGKNDRPGWLSCSYAWLRHLINRIVEAKGRGEAVWVTVV